MVNSILRLFKENGVLSFSGRINRAKFIMRSFITMGLYLLSSLFLALAILVIGDNDAAWIPFSIMVACCSLYGFANITKRLHDLNFSGFWLLAWLIILAATSPIIGRNAASNANSIAVFITSVILWCIPGTTGANKYGNDPLIQAKCNAAPGNQERNN